MINDAAWTGIPDWCRFAFAVDEEGFEEGLRRLQSFARALGSSRADPPHANRAGHEQVVSRIYCDPPPSCWTSPVMGTKRTGAMRLRLDPVRRS